jgi:hypothetical protein
MGTLIQAAHRFPNHAIEERRRDIVMATQEFCHERGLVAKKLSLDEFLDELAVMLLQQENEE